MPTKTLQELRNDVLRNIQRLGTEQSPGAGDAAEVEAVIRSVYDELRGDGIANFPLTAIPEWAQIGMRDMASFDMGYKATPQRRAEMASLRVLGRQRLLKQVAQEINPATTRMVDY